MPLIRNYTVIETREVRVTANNPVDAANLAYAHFREEACDVPGGSIRSSILDRSLEVREDD